MDLRSYIDHTLLKPETSKRDIENLCKEAVENNLFAVCVNSYFIPLVKELLAKSNVKIATVVGFPLGANDMFTKAYEANEAMEKGADEVDMVINIGMVKDGNKDGLIEEIAIVASLVHEHGGILKVIIETCLLTQDEKIMACQVCENAGADFVKTSTGFSLGGATVEDIKLMKSCVGDRLKIKASGSIRTREKALAMIEAGADRLGASASLSII